MAKRGGAAKGGNQEREEEEVIQGGPGDGDPAPNDRTPLRTSEDLVEVNVDGKTYSVPKAVAAHYQQREDGINSRFDKLEQGLAALRQPAPTTRKSTPAKGDTPDDGLGDEDFDTLILTNPREALRRAKDAAKKEVAEELRGEYAAQQARDRFWGDFYKTNKDLEKYTDFVDMVMGKNWNTISALPPDKAREKLAELSRKALLDIRGEEQPQDRRRNDRTRSESTSQDTRRPAGGRAESEEGDAEVVSLSGILKRRAEARRSGKKSA